MRRSRLAALALCATALILASRLFPVPSLVDAATGAPFSAHLEFPLSHLALTPLASFADVITCNAARQDIALVVLLLLGFGVFRFFILGQGPKHWFDGHDILIAAAFYVPLAVGYLAWAVLWPHAPPRFVADSPDDLPVDFHSHSRLSWDGRRTFTPERNAAWHQEAGFGVSFLTDHNVFETDRSNGEEVSLHDAHIVVVGNSKFADRKNYADTEAGVETFLSETRKTGNGVTILSLPEYWEHYWGEPLERLASSGPEGIEIFTSSPKAMEFPAAKRALAVDVAKRHGLFLAGATDNHGYGSCACVWNIVRLPDWRLLDQSKRQAAVLGVLKGGFDSVRVVARSRVEAARGDAVAFDGLRALWLMIRLWSPTQCLIALAWFWGLVFVRLPARRGGK